MRRYPLASSYDGQPSISNHLPVSRCHALTHLGGFAMLRAVTIEFNDGAMHLDLYHGVHQSGLFLTLSDR